MSTNNASNSATPILAFLLGAAIVVAGGLAYAAYYDELPWQNETGFEITLPGGGELEGSIEKN